MYQYHPNNVKHNLIMSFTPENVVTYVTNNPEEAAGIFNSLHVLTPGTQAFMKLCADNSVRPLRRTKGQYRISKRPQSAFNLFTRANKDNDTLKGLTFSERSRKIASLWKTLERDNNTEYERYQTMAKTMRSPPSSSSSSSESEDDKSDLTKDIGSDASITVEISDDVSDTPNETTSTGTKKKKTSKTKVSAVGV